MVHPPQRVKQLIGRSAYADFPKLGIERVPVRIDTGARTSALSVQSAQVQDNVLLVTLFDGTTASFPHYSVLAVSSSNGHVEHRYTIKTTIRIVGRSIFATFTLTDRSTQVYPVLVGRNVLRGKFIVDVEDGFALRAEKKKFQDLQKNVGKV